MVRPMWLIHVLTRLPTTIAVMGMPVAANKPIPTMGEARQGEVVIMLRVRIT